jgi:hypothetical protein
VRRLGWDDNSINIDGLQSAYKILLNYLPLWNAIELVLDV